MQQAYIRSDIHVLAIDGIKVFYDRVPIIEDTSFTAKGGERIAIVGRNGVGKSTLIKAILGFANVSGILEMEGRRLAGTPTSRMKRFGFGYLPQEHRVSPSLTVRDNLRTSAYNRTRDVKASLECWMQFKDSSGLRWPIPSLSHLAKYIWPLIGRAAHSLSGGEQAVVGIACAILSCTTFLFLDEPSAGASDEVLEALRYTLIDFTASSCHGLIFAEQNQRFLLELATSLLWLRQLDEQEGARSLHLPNSFLQSKAADSLALLDELEYMEGKGS